MGGAVGTAPNHAAQPLGFAATLQLSAVNEIQSTCAETIPHRFRSSKHLANVALILNTRLSTSLSNRAMKRCIVAPLQLERIRQIKKDNAVHGVWLAAPRPNPPDDRR